MPADAEVATIKRSFRRLAFQYHPDKHPDNKLKATHFLLIQEAYRTLLDPDARRAYDAELWLAQKNTFHHAQAITPVLLIKRLQQYVEKVKIKKQFYVLEDDAAAFLLDALNDKYMAIFQAKAGIEDAKVFADHIIFIAQDLPRSFRDRVLDRLKEVFAEQLTDLELKIFQVRSSKSSSDRYQKYLVWLTLVLGIFICVIMFFYAKK